MLKIYYRSTGKIEAYVTDTRTKDTIDGATASITLIDTRTNSNVSGSWPVTMTEDGNGIYSYSLDYDLLSGSVTYDAQVDVVKNSSRRRSVVRFKVITDLD